MTSKFKKKLTLIVTGLLMSVTLLSVVFPLASTANADSNPASWIMCMTEDGKLAYNAATTDYFHYSLRSKSAITETDDVEFSALNSMLQLAGHDFTGVNEAILGRPINPSSLMEESPSEANANANKFNAFDRFGVSGLRWSSYAGEWKYYQIDACSSSEQVSKTNFGSFYENRKEPKSTHSEVTTSRDPRSMQFNKGLGSSWLASFNDIIANFLFSITKAIVTLTIIFVGFAFSDVTSLIGLSPTGAAGTTAVGVFNSLFNGLFMVFVIMSVVVTGIYIIYYGIMKREVRRAMNIAAKSIFVFIFSVIISVNPAKFISLPNQITMYGQSMIISAMGTSHTGGGELCQTDAGLLANKKDTAYDAGEFEKISTNMRSVISCRLWEEMLFKPWVKGQFGTDYDNLNIENLPNINGEWTGDASVPLGNGVTVNNIALFHLSTQTTAHSALGKENNVPVYINGVSNDWWRIVDILSNYDEKMITEAVPDNAGTISYESQVQSNPLPQWQDWIGNNSSERTGIAFVSIAFGIIGSAPLLVFSFLSALYGLMLTLIMMFSPVFMMFGVAGERGQKIFMGWLELLINTMIKKVATAGLIVISFGLTMGAMDLIYTIGWVRSFLLLCVVTLVLVKNKDKILNSIANVDFGGIFNPGNTAREVMNKYKRRTRQAGLITTGGLSGGYAAVRTGQSVADGVKTGLEQQLHNTMRQSQFGQRAYMQYQATVRDADSSLTRTCVVCGLNLDELADTSGGQIIAFSDDYGNYYCQMCGEESDSDLHEVTLDNRDKKKFEDLSEGEVEDKYGTRTMIATKNRSWLSFSRMTQVIEPKYDDGKFTINEENTHNMIISQLELLAEDMVVFKNHQKKYGKVSAPPTIPEPLREYLDLAIINEAWTRQEFDYINHAYREAWSEWYTNNAGPADNISNEAVNKFVAELKDYEYEITEADELKIIELHSPANSEEMLKNFQQNKDVAKYENNKLLDKMSDKD